MHSLWLPGDDLMTPPMEYEERLGARVVAVPSGDKHWNYHFNRIIEAELNMINLQYHLSGIIGQHDLDFLFLNLVGNLPFSVSFLNTSRIHQHSFIVFTWIEMYMNHIYKICTT